MTNTELEILIKAVVKEIQLDLKENGLNNDILYQIKKLNSYINKVKWEELKRDSDDFDDYWTSCHGRR